MYSRLTYLIAAIALCFSFSKSYSQTDSIHYDLGRIQLNKIFTQNITIKAADLERQPFSNLSEAINVWFYGTYTATNNIAYVIDGNLVNDINVYNINDIEEVTLVQNSATQLNGTAQLQQLVLVKTKRKRPGKSGIEAAGQTNLVTIRNTANTPDVKSTTNLYHQYYLSGYKNTDIINAGVSATYLRDVLPILKPSSTSISTPLGFDRFKFNGYADVKAGDNNTLSATVNYVPQTSSFKYKLQSIPYTASPGDEIQTDLNDHEHQKLFNTNIQLSSKIAAGLTNKLSVSYNYYSYLQRYAFNREIDGYGYYYRSNNLDSTFNTKKVFLMQDNLSYRKTTGDFTFNPSINFSYRYTRDSVTNTTYETIYSGTNQQNLNLAGNSGATNSSSYKRKDYLLLPSLSISYKNSINIQGGFLAIVNSKKSLNLTDTFKLERVFPFLSATIDVSSLAGINVVGIKLYASYAKQNVLSQAANTQLAGVNSTYSNTLITQPATNANMPNYYFAPNYNTLRAFNNYTAGAGIDIYKSVTINYTFERGYLQIPIVYYINVPGSSGNYVILADSRYTANHIGLNFNIVNKQTIRFISGLNTTNINLKIITQNNPVNISDKIWTGGWVNRLEMNNIFAGLDMLYQAGKGNPIYANTSVYPLLGSQNANSFSLQNIYFGCRLKTKQFKNLEIFANGQNIWQNKKSNITDNRRSYGIGFKLGL